MQSAEDAEMKFLWNTNQISNEQYMDYATKRSGQYDMSNPAQTQDSIAWQRTVLGVRKEIRSDYRSQKLYEMSLTPGKDFEAKSAMYEELYKMAAEDNDLDAMLSIQTQYNNNLQAAAKAGEGAARKALSQKWGTMRNEIEDAKYAASQETDPARKAVLLANAAINEYQLNGEMAQVEDNPVSLQNIQQAMRKAEDNINKNAALVQGEVVTDANGDATFKPKEFQSATGETVYMPAEGVSEIIQDGQRKFVKDKQIYGFDKSGELVQEGGIDGENVVEMTDTTTQVGVNEDGTPRYRTYFARTEDKKQQELAGGMQWDDATGQYKKMNDVKSTKVVKDITGAERTFNPLTGKYELYDNPSALSALAKTTKDFQISQAAQKLGLSADETNKFREQMGLTALINPFNVKVQNIKDVGTTFSADNPYLMDNKLKDALLSVKQGPIKPEYALGAPSQPQLQEPMTVGSQAFADFYGLPKLDANAIKAAQLPKPTTPQLKPVNLAANIVKDIPKAVTNPLGYGIGKVATTAAKSLWGSAKKFFGF
jgi:hypothetical protein